MDSTKSAQERATRVRACNYIKIATRQNFTPVIKIVTHTVQAAQNINFAKRARDQFSIFRIILVCTMGFYWSYTLLL